MPQSAFTLQDPITSPVEYGFRVPAYFQDGTWRGAVAWAWAGLVALLLVAVCGWGVGIAGAQYAVALRSSYLAIPPAMMAVFLFRQGGFDLSMGAVAGTSAAVCAALVLRAELPLPVGVVAGMAAALAFGLVNGVVVGCLRVPGFLVTALTMTIGRSFVLSLTEGRTLFLAQLEAAEEGWSAAERVGWGLAAVVFVAALLLAQLRAPRSRSGAAWLSLGAPYVASSLVAGATGLLLMFYLRAATTSHGQWIEQDALFAVILGGSWLAGRSANAVGTLLGALVLAALVADLQLTNVDAFLVPRAKAELVLALLVLGVVVHFVVANAYARRQSALQPRPPPPPPAPAASTPAA